MGPFSPIFFIPWLGNRNGYINRKGLYTAQTKPKSRTHWEVAGSASGLGLAGPGRDGTAVIPARRPAGPAGRPAHSAQRHFDGHTFGLSPQRAIPPPPPHPHPIPTDMAKRERPVCLFPKYELIWNRTWPNSNIFFRYTCGLQPHWTNSDSLQIRSPELLTYLTTIQPIYSKKEPTSNTYARRGKIDSRGFEPLASGISSWRAIHWAIEYRREVEQQMVWAKITVTLPECRWRTQTSLDFGCCGQAPARRRCARPVQRYAALVTAGGRASRRLQYVPAHSGIPGRDGTGHTPGSRGGTARSSSRGGTARSRVKFQKLSEQI